MPNSMWGKFDLQLNKTRVKEFVDQVIIENLQVSSTRNHKTMDHPGIKQHPAKARMEWTFTLEVAPWWVGIFDRVVNLMTVLSYEEWMTLVVEVEMILSCRPLSYVSCKDPEDPIVPRKWQTCCVFQHYHDIDVQPQELSKRMQHLSNVLNHYWKR